MKGSKVSLEDYRKLVAMMAWKAWRRLPMQTRIWIGIEDMIESGMVQAWKLTQTYNPSWASFSTALYHRLHRHFINEFLEYHSSQQRGWHRVEGKLRPIPHKSIQAMEYSMKRNKEESYLSDVAATIPALVVSADSIENNALTECFVVPTLEKIYQEATPRLKQAIVEWFLSTEAHRIHNDSKRFKKSAKEFRELCQHEHLVFDDCLHLVRSPACLDKLSRDLFGIPHNLDRPCPTAERVL